MRTASTKERVSTKKNKTAASKLLLYLIGAVLWYYHTYRLNTQNIQLICCDYQSVFVERRLGSILTNSSFKSLHRFSSTALTTVLDVSRPYASNVLGWGGALRTYLCTGYNQVC